MLFLTVVTNFNCGLGQGTEHLPMLQLGMHDVNTQLTPNNVEILGEAKCSIAFYVISSTLFLPN